MRKLLVAAIALTVLLAITGCNASINQGSTTATQQDSTVNTGETLPILSGDLNDQESNPIIDFETLEEMQTYAEFTFEIPKEVPTEYSKLSYYSVWDYVFRVSYKNSDDEEILFSMSDQYADPSGDYNEYSNTKVETVGDVPVKFSTNSDDNTAKCLARWTVGGIRYSITGATVSQATDMIKSM
ncbi:MAG TPA: hypothetical protein GX401_07220 [Clostridiales bacterium]|nr:hypothetical protein [Clostridiales bacterium]